MQREMQQLTEEQQMSARPSMDNNDVPLHSSSRLTIGALQQDASASMNMDKENSGNTSGDNSMFMRISNGLIQMKNRVVEKASQITFELYGTYSNEYSKVVKDVFNESYFLEAWITEMLTTKQKRTPEEEILLGKLSRISKFLHENILGIVMSDILVLIEFYYM